MRAHGWGELAAIRLKGANVGRFTHEKGWKPVVQGLGRDQL
jgi:hypothetical protein